MRRILGVTAVLVAGLALAGCSSSSGSSSSVSDAKAPAAGEALGTKADAVAGSETSSSDVSRSAASDSGSSGTNDGRDVVTTGTATITAEDPVSAADRAAALVEGAAGRVDDRQQQAPTNGDKGSASLTLRIPSATLTPTLDRIKKLGTVESLQLAADDVTRQTQDLDARISAKRASVDRLLVLLKGASTTKDLISLDSAISNRQGDLESMEAEQRSLADQVAYSSIVVSFISVANAPVHAPATFWSGLGAGWDSFVAFVAGALVVAGVAIPWVVFLAVIAFIVVAIVRVRRRRARRGLPSVGGSA